MTPLDLALGWFLGSASIAAVSTTVATTHMMTLVPEMEERSVPDAAQIPIVDGVVWCGVACRADWWSGLVLPGLGVAGG